MKLTENGTTRGKAFGANEKHVDAMIAVDLDQALLNRRLRSIQVGIKRRRLARVTQAESAAVAAGSLLSCKSRLDSALHTWVESMLTQSIGDRLDGDGHTVLGKSMRSGFDRIRQLAQLLKHHLIKLTCSSISRRASSLRSL